MVIKLMGLLGHINRLLSLIDLLLSVAALHPVHHSLFDKGRH
jgi:hypothetical protein